MLSGGRVRGVHCSDFKKIAKFVAYYSDSHAFGLAELNGTIHFALRHRETVPHSTSTYPPKAAPCGRRAVASEGLNSLKMTMGGCYYLQY